MFKKREKKKIENRGINKKGRKFFISSLAVVCFLVLFAGVGMATATDYYVATGGSDSNIGTSLDHAWQHPSYAVQQAQAGDTIYLVDGTWKNEHMVFANSGTRANPITLKAYSGTPTLDGVDKTGIGIRIEDKSYISISGFRLKNYNIGIDGDGLLQHISISDFTIEDMNKNGILLTSASIQNSEITDFTIQRTGGSAIYRTGSYSGCFDITISDFVIKDIPDTAGTGGIWWERTKGLHIQHGEVHNVRHGVQLQRSIDDTIIDDVKVFDAAFHGICITDPNLGPYPCHENIIKNCYVDHTGHNGIDIQGTYETTITDCEITGNEGMGQGIFFRNLGSGLTVRDCIIYGASSADSDRFRGIVFGSQPDVTIEGCTLYNLKSAIEGSGGDYTVRNNVIYSISWSDTIKLGSNNILCENNDIRGGRYRINNGHGTIRNSLGNSYQVRSYNGATVTVEYTDGKTFSVDGSGSYTSHVITSNDHRIEVLGEVSTGTISGVVTTITGSPIEGAAVTVEGAGKSDETDSSGVYEITDVPVGTYTVTASASGYEDTATQSVKVIKGEITTLNFLLTAEASQDTTPPAAVTDLATSDPSSHSITLTWTAPGDDEDTGTATKYDIRYSTSAITGANWDSAVQCTDEPTPQEAGSTETFTVTGLSPDKAYYFALKTADEVTNWSDISNSASGTTTEEQIELACYLGFDEGSGNTAEDTSGNNNEGTIHGASWAEGKLGKALSFDGTNDYVDCGRDTSLKITGAITVEAWVKWTGDGNPYFVTKTGGSAKRSYDLSGNADGTVEFRVGDSDCKTFKSSGTTPIPAGKWVYLVGTYEPSNYVRLFVNGALAEEDTTSIPAAQGENGLSWYIGSREGNQGWFKGIIDEVKIYNGALSAEEIRANYEANPTNNQPTAIIDSITPDTAEQGKATVSFTGHGTDTDGTVATYNWRSDVDGQLSTASSFGKPASELSVGTHTIYFKVQDDKGAWSTEVTKDLTIMEPANQAPVADPSGPYTGTEGVAIDYDGSGSYDPDGNIISYDWDFGDGNTATGVAPTHTYAQEGTYTVTLNVTDTEGAINTSTTTATIADTEPTADFSATPTSGSRRLTVEFTDNSASYDGVDTWEWDFDNDGGTDSTEQNPTHVYTKAGVYTVSLTVYECDGGSDTMTREDYIEVIKMKEKITANP
ncbi:PKD repeat-containing protein [Methanophagales archaeon]|nr:PKD repeat-containing protein [Methanophagales archaeon]